MNAERIKEIRKKKGITLKTLAQATDYTESYLSQLERGLKNPSLEALRRVSKALDVAIITFLIEDAPQRVGEEEAFLVIRGGERKKVFLPTMSLPQELVTPAFGEFGDDQKFQGYFMQMAPNEMVSERMVAHNAEESVLVVSGTVTIYVGEEQIQLGRGDSIYLKGGVMHNFINDSDGIAEVIVYATSERYSTM